MIKSLLTHIQTASKKGEKLLAILLDPDKSTLEEIPSISKRIEHLNAHFIFVGGSVVEREKVETRKIGGSVRSVWETTLLDDEFG